MNNPARLSKVFSHLKHLNADISFPLEIPLVSGVDEWVMSFTQLLIPKPEGWQFCLIEVEFTAYWFLFDNNSRLLITAGIL